MADVITRFKVETDQFDRKINSAKRSLDQFGLKGTEAGRNIEGMTQALNINLSSISKLSVGLAAAGGALKVMGDAFKRNEVLQDEWGRITEASKSVYDGFLNSINTGDFSGFFKNIDNIVNAARKAYDALDELGTFNAFNQIQIEAARTGFNEAISEFRSGKGSKADVDEAADILKKELEARQKREEEAYIKEINKIAESRNVNAKLLKDALTGTYENYEKIKNMPMTGVDGSYTSGGMFGGSQYIEKAVPANEMEKLAEKLNGLTDEELKNLQALGAQAQRTETEIAMVDKQVSRLRSGGTSTAGTAAGGKTTNTETVYPEGSIGAAEAELKKLNEQWKLAADDGSRAEIKKQIDALNESIKAMRGETEKAKVAIETGTSGYSQANIQAIQEELKRQMANMQLGSDEYMAALAQSIDLTTFSNLVNEAIRNGIQIDPFALEGIFDQIFNGDSIPPSVWQNLEDDINAQLAKLGIEPIKVDVQTGNISQQETVSNFAVLGEEASKSWSYAASAVGSVGSALQSLEDPSSKIAGIIASAIANVAAGLGQMLSQPQSTSQSWGWVALAASGAATMMSTVAAIKSVTAGCSEGGILGSLNGSLNSPSGDNIVARLNAGEGVLTRTGIETAQRMSRGGAANMRFEKIITGSEIRLILSNDNRARGGSRSAYGVR